MKFSPNARAAEEFERALRGDSEADAFRSEFAVLERLTELTVSPDPAFSAALRASLLEAAGESVVAASSVGRAARPTRSRWRLAAPLAAAALASGGVAFAVTGMQAGTTSRPAVAPSPTASALSSANARLAALTQQLRTGTSTVAALNSLREQALQLQQLLTTAYASGRNPAAMRQLHEFAVEAIKQLSSLSADIPAGLQQVYRATLLTLHDIAATAESTCATCHLAPVPVPLTVIQPTSPGRLPTSLPSPAATSTATPTPSTSSTTGPPVTAPTPSVSAPSAPVPTPTGLPTISAPPPLASLPAPSPLELPTIPS